MKKNLAVAVFTLGISMCFLPNMSLAQEAKKPAEETNKPAAPEATPPAGEAADETEFSYGTVKSVAANQIVVSEYDYDGNKDVDVTYSVPADAKLENAASLQEVKVGDSVDIDFTVKSGQKVASAITVEKPTAEDEDAALGADAGADTGAAAEPEKTE